MVLIALSGEKQKLWAIMACTRRLLLRLAGKRISMRDLVLYKALAHIKEFFNGTWFISRRERQVHVLVDVKVSENE